MHRTTRGATALLFPLALLLGLAPLGPGRNAAATPQQRSDDYRIIRDVNLVVLHTRVLDRRGHFVPDLREEYFRVFEDNVEQKLAVFRREDIPVTVGLVIDNSGSMRDKRERVIAGSLAFIKASNPEDEVFVVNFNDDYFLDTEKDFTNDINELREALERIDARGSTALYDAVVGSLDHLKKGSRDKRVLVIVSDGEDNASRKSLEQTVQEIQLSNAVVYAIGLLSQESRRAARRARNALDRMVEASGGLAFYPEGVEDVENICLQIAHDIRNQYTLAYYPTNTRRDGSFRTVRVEVNAPRNYGRLTVRTRTGYFAQAETPGN